MNLQLRTGELGHFEVALVLLDGLTWPLEIGGELVGCLDLHDRRLLVDRHVVELGLGVADLKPVLERRQNLRDCGHELAIGLIGKHRQGRLRLAGLANIQRRDKRLVHGVVDLGGDLEARSDQDLGIAGIDLDDLHRADRGDERERVQNPAGRGGPGWNGRAAEQGQAHDRGEHQERLEKVAGSLHAKSEPAPAVLPGRGLVEGEIRDGRGRLSDGRLPERVGLGTVAARKLDDIDQVALQLGKRQLHAPGGRRQAPPSPPLSDQQQGNGGHAQSSPDREEADEHRAGAT